MAGRGAPREPPGCVSHRPAPASTSTATTAIRGRTRVTSLEDELERELLLPGRDLELARDRLAVALRADRVAPGRQRAARGLAVLAARLDDLRAAVLVQHAELGPDGRPALEHGEPHERRGRELELDPARLARLQLDLHRLAHGGPARARADALRARRDASDLEAAVLVGHAERGPALHEDLRATGARAARADHAREDGARHEHEVDPAHVAVLGDREAADACLGVLLALFPVPPAVRAAGRYRVLAGGHEQLVASVGAAPRAGPAVRAALVPLGLGVHDHAGEWRSVRVGEAARDASDRDRHVEGELLDRGRVDAHAPGERDLGAAADRELVAAGAGELQLVGAALVRSGGSARARPGLARLGDAVGVHVRAAQRFAARAHVAVQAHDAARRSEPHARGLALGQGHVLLELDALRRPRPDEELARRDAVHAEAALDVGLRIGPEAVLVADPDRDGRLRAAVPVQDLAEDGAAGPEMQHDVRAYLTRAELQHQRLTGSERRAVRAEDERAGAEAVDLEETVLVRDDVLVEDEGQGAAPFFGLHAHRGPRQGRAARVDDAPAQHGLARDDEHDRPGARETHAHGRARRVTAAQGPDVPLSRREALGAEGAVGIAEGARELAREVEATRLAPVGDDGAVRERRAEVVDRPSGDRESSGEREHEVLRPDPHVLDLGRPHRALLLRAPLARDLALDQDLLRLRGAGRDAVGRLREAADREGAARVALAVDLVPGGAPLRRGVARRELERGLGRAAVGPAHDSGDRAAAREHEREVRHAAALLDPPELAPE